VAALAARGGERETLEAFLDYHREAVIGKVSGVSDADARKRLVPSLSTLGGIVKHLRWVEQHWFEHILHGTSSDELPVPPYTDDDPDGDFRVEPDDTVQDLIRAYTRQCERSRATAVGHDLADTGRHRLLGEVSLRWIYVHMIEETARHAGHVDILREQLDGIVGD
jgi:hypothetical protein